MKAILLLWTLGVTFYHNPSMSSVSPTEYVAKPTNRPRLFSRDGIEGFSRKEQLKHWEQLEREAMEEAIAEPRIGADGKDRSMSKERMANGSGRRDVVGFRKHLEIYYET